jgi:hypothetical protein
MKTLSARFVAVLALCLPLLVVAQSGSDPADANAPAPTLRYQSPFVDYKAWQDIPQRDWRQLNENVQPAPHGKGDASSQPTVPPAPAASAPRELPPAMHDHQHQHMHGDKR